MFNSWLNKIGAITRCISLHKLGVCLATSLMSVAITHSVHAAPAQFPLFLANPVVPIMMLNMSKDHQLYFKVYDDYSDLDGDKIPDTTYKNGYSYYGYFDSKKCYTYSDANRFVPARKVNDSNYCNYGGVTNEWSGNFLNWASMTRMDSIRKILYGGLRSTDTSTATVLERAFLPNDAHSFAKFYNGSDLSDLTPFSDATAVPRNLSSTAATGITICNTTNGGANLSQNVTSAPLLRVAKGNYTFWASNERWQCRWQSEKPVDNGNDPAVTGEYAYRNAPEDTDKLGTGSAAGEYHARVQVCVTDLEEDNCYVYPDGNKKPQGLLQEFGEVRGGASVAKINFGLMTGSYKKNKSGGVLRKTVGNMSAEVNATTNGTFTNTAGIIKTLNLFRIYGYRYDDGTYFGTAGSDNCSWALNSFSNGDCTNWGNPQAEIYLESLRYLAGKTANTGFTSTTDDSSMIPGLVTAAWTAPVTSANSCAPLNVLQFNASTVSYDGDQLGGASDIIASPSSLESWTNLLADAKRENLSGNYFVGNNGTTSDGLCTAKSFGNLSSIKGTCPDAPRLEGSYHLAGLAYYARTNDFVSSVTGIQTVRTYGVALAPALPKLEIPVPGDANKKVTILPACRETGVGTAPNHGACAIVDFKILSQSTTDTTNSGTLYVNWEDSEQGGDYDQDFWGVIDYSITATTATIATDVIISSIGSNKMGFGYVISGTETDGPHFHSGVNGYSEYECSNCTVGNGKATRTWTIGTSSDKFLESPLFYAAKWGGFSETLVKSAVGDSYTYADRLSYYGRDDVLSAIKSVTKPESYNFATDPRLLEASLRSAFNSIAASIGSASAVATNSTRLSEGSYVFQAQFNSDDWSGALNAYEFTDDGSLPIVPTFSTNDSASMPKTGAGRNVYTYNGTNVRALSWENLTDPQKEALQLSTETTDANAQKRVDWLLGNNTYENNASGLRERGSGDKRNILGDIVNSSPAYVGAWDFRYNRLPVGGSSYRDYVETKKTKMPRIVVGANDGMVHVFQAPTKEITSGDIFRELYAYIPSFAFPKIAGLTQPNYGTTENPHQFIVDGPITVGDVYIGDRWRTIVVGTLGAGGKGIYALDVTEDTEPHVLWELSEADYPALGYVMGKPLIVPMKNNRWAVVLGNGSESETFSNLLVIDIEAPRTNFSQSLSTEAGIGLSAPELLSNGVGQIEVAYAGDLSGNLWRFDLSSADSSDWEKQYLIFKAVDKDNKPQPIHAAPTLGLNPKMNNKIMVYFGAGKYFDSGDNATPVSPQYSFYAIADVGTEVTRSSLFEKTLDTNYSTRTRKVLQDISTPIQSPNWSVHKGWRLDFNDTAGERVTTKAILLQDRLIFPTLIPSGVACEFGGKSWLMQVKAIGINNTPLPGLPDGSPPASGLLNDYLVLGDLGLGRLPEKPPSSSSSSSSAPSDECTNGSTGQAAIVGSGTNAALMNVGTTYSVCGEGRQSWRQLQ
jgi:type IV pilus assembly protein PilY1